ncbi:unnamed protein product, partial [Leptidea sinapis]
MGYRMYILFISFQLIYMTNAQQMFKRIPEGFVGLRGKKALEQDGEQFFKRRPQFFVGVKGKKSYDSSEDSWHYKRAPMGFVGMRGKKDYNDYIPDNYYMPQKGSLFGQIDYTTNEFTPSEEYPILNQFYEYIQNLQENSDSSDVSNDLMTNEIDKRAFYGVRGKKSIQNKRPYDLSFRGKFIGVRGKKDVKDSGAKEIKFLLDGPWPKRKFQTGFVGMRGKKATDTGDYVV